MPDTKISDMTAVAGGLSALDEIAVADASDLAANANVTAAVLSTFVKTDSLGLSLAVSMGMAQSLPGA